VKWRRRRRRGGGGGEEVGGVGGGASGTSSTECRVVGFQTSVEGRGVGYSEEVNVTVRASAVVERLVEEGVACAG